jgi:hypothetical protein
MRRMSDVRDVTPSHDDAMARYPDHHQRSTPEERRFLDALVFWRGLYAERGPSDRETVHSLPTVIAEAERRMKELRTGAPS